MMRRHRRSRSGVDPRATGTTSAETIEGLPVADRDRFVLSAAAAVEWDALTSRPARDLPSVRALMARPSPVEPPPVAP